MVFTKEEIFNVPRNMNRFVISILFFLVLERHEVLTCLFENEVMYEGKCHDVFETVCSESPGKDDNRIEEIFFEIFYFFPT